MSAGIGATVIAREVAGVGVAVVSSWVDTGVDVSVEDAGVGVTAAVVGPWCALSRRSYGTWFRRCRDRR